jgi:hypothetical protein
MRAKQQNIARAQPIAAVPSRQLAAGAIQLASPRVRRPLMLTLAPDGQQLFLGWVVVRMHFVM